MTRRGRQPGQLQLGSTAWALSRLSVGEHLWVELTDTVTPNNVIPHKSRLHGPMRDMAFAQRRYYATSPGCDTVTQLVKITRTK